MQTSQETKISSKGFQVSIHLICVSILAQASILVSEGQVSEFSMVHTVIYLFLSRFVDLHTWEEEPQS